MQIGIDYGREHLDLEIPESRLVGISRACHVPSLADPAAAVRAALEAPLGFPPLRQALTPDDHVVVVIDEHLPRLADLLSALLQYLTEAAIAPEAITLLCPPSSSRQPWLEDLPETFQEVHVEVHDPSDRRQLSYLATTRTGRRLYLNRTAVDADQLVVLAGRRYDPLLGYAGAEGAIYPALSDTATREEFAGQLSLLAPGKTPWPVRQEAAEVAWLLGAPFFIQVIEGSGEDIAAVIAGLADTSAEGQRLLDEHWRRTVGARADTVIAAVAGNAADRGFENLAAALLSASRVVQPNGRVVLLGPARPALHADADLLRQADNPQQALELLRNRKPADPAAVFEWAGAAQKAQIYWLSGLPAETAEELFTVPLDRASQVQRLLDQGGSCLVLADAHKVLAVVED